MDADKRGGILEKRSLSRIFSGKFAAAAVAILGLCLIGTLAVCGTISAQAVKLDSDCSIKVQLSPEEDASTAPKGLVYDIYQVATAQEVSNYDAYTFEATTPFSGAISEQLNNLSSATASNTASGVYSAIAQSATGVVLNDADGNAPAVKGGPKPVSLYKEELEGDTFNNLQSGLYLVLVHGKTPASKNKYIIKNDDDAYVTVANATNEKYLFSPLLIAVPSRYSVNTDGTITNSTSNTNDKWQYNVTATLKFTKEPRYGAIAIEKELTSYNQGEPATFVFRIEGFESANPGPNEEAVFSNVESIVFNGAGTQTVPVDRIPAGLYVKVTEIYSGSKYKLVSQDPTGLIKITANADNSTTPTVKFTFVNEYDGPGNGSGSVTNSFSYESGEGAARSASHWVWSKDGEVQE